MTEGKPIKALTMTEYQILDELSWREQASQSQLLENINLDRKDNGIEPLATGTVISCMPVLEKKGLIEEVTGKQKRKEYCLTEQGKTSLLAHYRLLAVNNPDWSDD